MSFLFRDIKAPATRQQLEKFVRRKPWERSAPQDAVEALKLKGMLGPKESLLFFHLARELYSGRGQLVDAGSFLGKSATFFAAGLRGNPAARKTGLKVRCFDNFLVNEPATADFIRENFGREIAIGDSTRDLFDRQVAPIRGMLEVHQGDFLRASWPRTPIELLMVDIAKSPRLWARMMTEMFPSLIPGVSLVIHQDYHHPWLGCPIFISQWSNCTTTSS